MTSQQLWKYLPHVPNSKKIHPNFKRKSEVTDKQVLNLTGGFFPVKLVDHSKDQLNLSQQQINGNPSDKWMYVPIKQRNPNIGPIYHWVKQSEQQKIYHGDKFNIEPNLLEFTQEQYDSLNLPWKYLDVVDIFQKLKKYNFNFIVVQDRIQTANQCSQMASEDQKQNFTIEDLKDIFFTVNRQILQARGEKDNLLSSYIYDKKYEKNRKFQLQKYLMRSKADTDREKFLMNEIKRLQIIIKKEQREQINLKKAIKMDEVPQQVFKINQNTDIQALYKNQKVYSRQQLLTKPIDLPGKVDEKLTQVLLGLSIPDKIIATKENMELYDNLRRRILLMFSIQRYIRKKENQKRNLEQKKKKVSMQEEDEKNHKMYPLKAAEGQPRKKHKS